MTSARDIRRGRPVIGVDIGKKRDPTAIAVVEPEERQVAGGTAVHYAVRHLERLALGTAYPQVNRRLTDLCWKVARRSQSAPEVLVDATGVGTPVVDALRTQHLGASKLWAVYLTHGQKRTERPDSTMSLGKARLVSRLQALLGSGRLHLPATGEAKALAAELLDYEIRVSASGTDRYGAFRSGTHDDLVTALGLAVQGRIRWRS